MRTERGPLRPGTRMTRRSQLLAEYLDGIQGETVQAVDLSKTELLVIMRDRRFYPEDNEHLDPQRMAESIKQKIGGGQ